ncbi:CinA family protein [Thauera sinica]|uniref:CinA family protein n=1 Tax=Thauera sinica TaxID=2665146 RepID=A0ABW1ASW3_9RHOO|nr:CinA family protein [Thauera sp. K11]ATE61388.1 damage-inducible protein CinA [Thauera sp. K11]
MMTAALDALSAALGQALAARGWMLATAESCTGGWIAEAVTATAGSSGWFDRGFVTYSNEAKMDMLGVSPATLAVHGAVSEQTVREMAAGALARSRAQVAVAVSGVAGPGGGSTEKPVGMVCLAWARRGAAPQAVTMHFGGDREAVRRQTVEHALRELIRFAG